MTAAQIQTITATALASRGTCSLRSADLITELADGLGLDRSSVGEVYTQALEVSSWSH